MPAKNRDSARTFRSLVQSARGEGGISCGRGDGISLGSGECTTSGRGSGSPEGTSGGGISGGAGGRITSGSGMGMASFGRGVGMLPRFLHGNARGRAFVPAARKPFSISPDGSAATILEKNRIAMKKNPALATSVVGLRRDRIRVRARRASAPTEPAFRRRPWPAGEGDRRREGRELEHGGFVVRGAGRLRSFRTWARTDRTIRSLPSSEERQLFRHVH
jgi:hypothetical protein